ncbi:hypothetical protein GIB67_019474 [Kingdonia uniflora]|uniref:GATA-type domain-containing protein n=1 Tax=Kingdonia uniflora TaxID=39325 RepID=A0A7J7N0G2_9MAGN|nr:hypothetical protein GIB67_019474 [Kingdonia uniflora]
MFHQTLPPLFFTSPSATTTSFSFSSSSLPQVMKVMEVNAFKTSFLAEIVLPNVTQQQQQQHQQSMFEDVSGDDFLVDDLLDFSEEDDGVFKEEEIIIKHEEEEEDEEKGFNGVSSEIQNLEFNGVSAKHDFSELNVPVDDLAELEWVSQFIEDSSGLSLQYQLEKCQKTGSGLNQNKSKLEPDDDSSVKSGLFSASVPGKARSKRSRTGGRVWSVRETPTLSSSSSSSGSGYGSTTSSGSGSGSTSCLIFTNMSPNFDYFYRKPPRTAEKKIKRKRVRETGSTKTERRCSHCGVQKTPQWREGPLGAKTLCNACGVRFKSGRLFPEYRPACSPSFSSAVHSNSHRKVLEMRRKKVSEQPGSTFSCTVQSF